MLETQRILRLGLLGLLPLYTWRAVPVVEEVPVEMLSPALKNR